MSFGSMDIWGDKGVAILAGTVFGNDPTDIAIS